MKRLTVLTTIFIFVAQAGAQVPGLAVNVKESLAPGASGSSEKNYCLQITLNNKSNETMENITILYVIGTKMPVGTGKTGDKILIERLRAETTRTYETEPLKVVTSSAARRSRDAIAITGVHGYGVKVLVNDKNAFKFCAPPMREDEMEKFLESKKSFDARKKKFPSGRGTQ